jgi:hypothetical protein
LRENPLPGRISLSYEREPSYFAAAALEGPFHQTLVAREGGTGEVLACASRSVRLRFVDGEARPVGYMSQLRFHPRLRRGMGLARLLSRAFSLFHALHEDGRAPYYLVSVVAGNGPARRLLTRGLPGFPRLRPVGRLVTHAIHLGRRRRPLPPPRGLRLEAGSAARLPALLACLDRNGRRRQLAPCWTAETLCRPEHTPGLSLQDFSLALDGERVVGCLAAWDQSAVKQLVVRGYSGALAVWRPALNLLAPFGGWPRLPAPGDRLRSCYASHGAVDGDDPEVFAALLRSVYNRAVRRGCRFLTIGLGAADPLRSVLAGYRATSYPSDLYLAAWEDGEAAASKIDGRLADPEIAVL